MAKAIKPTGDFVLDYLKQADPDQKYLKWGNKDFLHFVKYGLTSLIASILNLILLFIFTDYVFGHDVTSLVFSLLISTIFSFILNRMWGYREAHVHSNKNMLAKYLALNATTYFLNILIFMALRSMFNLHYIIAEIIAMLAVFFVNFLGSHKWVFKVET